MGYQGPDVCKASTLPTIISPPPPTLYLPCPYDLFSKLSSLDRVKVVTSLSIVNFFFL